MDRMDDGNGFEVSGTIRNLSVQDFGDEYNDVGLVRSGSKCIR